MEPAASSLSAIRGRIWAIDCAQSLAHRFYPAARATIGDGFQRRLVHTTRRI